MIYLLKWIMGVVLSGTILFASASDQRIWDFELPDLEGKNHKLSDNRGKIVILDFWAIWCGPCREVFPVLNEFKEKYRDQEVVFWGINLDKKDRKDVQRFVEKAGIRYPILHDPEGKTAALFEIAGLPTLILIRPDGIRSLVKRGFIKKEQGELIKIIDEELKQWHELQKKISSKSDKETIE